MGTPTGVKGAFSIDAILTPGQPTMPEHTNDTTSPQTPADLSEPTVSSDNESSHPVLTEPIDTKDYHPPHRDTPDPIPRLPMHPYLFHCRPDFYRHDLEGRTPYYGPEGPPASALDLRQRGGDAADDEGSCHSDDLDEELVDVENLGSPAGSHVSEESEGQGSCSTTDPRPDSPGDRHHAHSGKQVWRWMSPATCSPF